MTYNQIFYKPSFFINWNCKKSRNSFEKKKSKKEQNYTKKEQKKSKKEQFQKHRCLPYP